jgi:hypothetical protein
LRNETKLGDEMKITLRLTIFMVAALLMMAGLITQIESVHTMRVSFLAFALGSVAQNIANLFRRSLY